MNPQLIRLLASQYRDLQGPRTIVDTVFPLAYAAFLVVARSDWDILPALAIAGVWLWFRADLGERPHRSSSMTSRSGRVRSRGRALPYALLFVQFVALGTGHTVMSWPPVLRAALLMVGLTY